MICIRTVERRFGHKATKRVTTLPPIGACEMRAPQNSLRSPQLRTPYVWIERTKGVLTAKLHAVGRRPGQVTDCC